MTALPKTRESEGVVCRCIGIPILHSIDRLGWDSNLRSIDHRETNTQALTDHGYGDIDQKKNCYTEKSVFSCPSTTLRNFGNPFTFALYFHNFWPALLQEI